MKNFKKELAAAKVLSKETVREMAEAILNNIPLSDKAMFEMTVLNKPIIDKDSEKSGVTEALLWDLWCNLDLDDFLEDKEYRALTEEAKRKDRAYRKTKKNTTRDKSRHGWRKGSRHEGWGRSAYELYSKPDCITRDMRKDLKNQMMDLENVYISTSEGEMFQCVWSIIKWKPIDEDVINLAMSFTPEIAKTMSIMAKQVEDFIKAKRSTISYKEVYDILDDIFFEDSLEAREQVARAIIKEMEDCIDRVEDWLMEQAYKAWKKYHIR